MKTETEKKTTTTWICPSCLRPTAKAGYLGWRDCEECGWEERLPTHLDEAPATKQPR